MYGIDWTAPIPAPGKTCKTKKGKVVKEAKKVRAAGTKGTWTPRKPSNPRGRRKGDGKNPPESYAKSAKSISEGAWRRRATDKGGSMQSGSGGADEGDFSMSDNGRVYPRFSTWDRSWDGD